MFHVEWKLLVLLFIYFKNVLRSSNLLKWENKKKKSLVEVICKIVMEIVNKCVRVCVRACVVWCVCCAVQVVLVHLACQ